MALQDHFFGRAIFLAVCGLVVIAFAVYNVFFHPLSKYPGPKSAAASQILCAWHTVRGTLPYWIKGLHDQFGTDVVRISPRELSFINASAWQDIYGNRPGHHSFEKDPAVYGKPPNNIGSLLTANRDDHTRMRRVLGHAFSDRASRLQEPIVESYVDILIKRLHDQVEGTERGKVDVSKWFRWMSFDIAGDLSFGESFECLQNQGLHHWADMITGFLKADTCLGACNRFFALRRILPYLIPEQTRRMRDDHWAATTEKVTRRMQLGTRRPDFISPIIKYNEEGKGLTLGEIKSNASLFIVAGSDSVATVLTGTTFYLLQNPEVMRKLTDEIRTTFKTEEEIDARSVARLPYMLACLDETNRIYPTILTGQAVVVPPEGDMVGNNWIPGGTGLSINMYAAYRSQRNFRDPDAYVPDRWLGDPRFATDQRDVYHPFSFGHRNCIGKNIGTIEQRLGLARMIWNFSIELSEETDPNWLDQKAFVTWQRKDLVVKLQPRMGIPFNLAPFRGPNGDFSVWFGSVSYSSDKRSTSRGTSRRQKLCSSSVAFLSA